MFKEGTSSFISALGFSQATIHSRMEHFDFQAEGRIFMVLGPMGSGKTQFAAQVWRDSRVIRRKNPETLRQTQTPLGARRTDIFFIRSQLDAARFQDNPPDALSYRGGYERLGNDIAYARNSYEIEALIDAHPEKGLWIIDEPAFYDERLAYLLSHKAKEHKLTFLLTGIVLNFRRNIFNQTTQLLLETVTDVIPLTAYCEHPDCLEKTFLTYRYYRVDDQEVPALFFDPLILVGGDVVKDSSSEPNYEARCAHHHFMIGKEYTYCHLLPLARAATSVDGVQVLKEELRALKNEIELSHFCRYIVQCEQDASGGLDIQKLLGMPYLAEKALQYLFQEENLLSQDLFLEIIDELVLDKDYLNQILKGMGRPILVKGK